MKDFSPINYSNDLNARQKENYNFHKFAARLADYGFTCIRLTDDYQGADFIALHKDGKILRVQLKGRLTFDEKYYGKELYVAFREGGEDYLYPHDELRKQMLSTGYVDGSSSKAWIVEGSRSWPKIPKKIQPLLDEYKL